MYTYIPLLIEVIQQRTNHFKLEIVDKTYFMIWEYKLMLKSLLTMFLLNKFINLNI